MDIPICSQQDRGTLQMFTDIYLQTLQTNSCTIMLTKSDTQNSAMSNMANFMSSSFMKLIYQIFFHLSSQSSWAKYTDKDSAQLRPKLHFFCWIKWTRRKVCYVWHSRVLSTAKPCGKRPHGKRTSLGRDFEIPKTY